MRRDKKKTSYGKIRGHQEDKNVVFETREFLINIITQYIYIFNIYIKTRDICSKNTRNINLEQYVLFF
ncbi:hypothetical protein CN914_29675 [Bacillus thuringiensis]|nr:hypothetical protein CN914_29675 [Bacillus thuringiensis]